MREGNKSLNESVEASLKAFDMSSNKLQLYFNNFIDDSVNATIQRLYDVGLFDRLENTAEIFKDYISFNKRGRGGVCFANDSQSE